MRENFNRLCVKRAKCVGHTLNACDLTDLGWCDGRTVRWHYVDVDDSGYRMMGT